MMESRGQSALPAKTGPFPAILKRAVDHAGAVIFAVLFLTLVVQVVLRFVFGAPAAWTEELGAIAFIWTIFWGTAFTVPLSYHAALDPLVPFLPRSARRVLYSLGLGALAFCFLLVLPGTADYVGFMTRERTPVLEWPTGYVYSVFLVSALAVVMRCIAGIARPTGEVRPPAR